MRVNLFFAFLALGLQGLANTEHLSYNKPVLTQLARNHIMNHCQFCFFFYCLVSDLIDLTDPTVTACHVNPDTAICVDCYMTIVKAIHEKSVSRHLRVEDAQNCDRFADSFAGELKLDDGGVISCYELRDSCRCSLQFPS